MKVVSIIFLAFFIVIFSGSPAAAKSQEIQVSVNGMVCSLCIQGIEKKFKKMDHVKTVRVDLDQKIVYLEVTDGELFSDDMIKKTISDAGYAVVKIKRD